MQKDGEPACSHQSETCKGFTYLRPANFLELKGSTEPSFQHVSRPLSVRRLWISAT
jgi:hypothetical protein